MYDGQIILGVVVGFLIACGTIGMVNGGGLGARSCIGRRVVRSQRRTQAPAVLSRTADTTRVLLTLVGLVGGLIALACLVF